MSYRLHAIKTIAFKRLCEILVSPAFYIALSACFLAACFLVTSFVSMIGSDGINTGKSAVYDLIFNMSGAMFGGLFVDRMFAQGPFVFALSLSMFAFSTYLGTSTVLQFGSEKDSGALEVIASGPADETCCFLAYFAVNVLLTIAFLLATTVILFTCALIANLALASSYFSSLLFLLLGSVVIYVYCALASCLTRGAFSALACLTAVLLLFVGIQFGMYGTVSENGNMIAGTLSFAFQWVSPFLPINLGSEATEYGSAILFVLATLVPLVVCSLTLLGSHFISRKRGARI